MSTHNVKNALVTGAAKRLGREIAIGLARDGWNVAIHHNNTSPDSTAAEIVKLGRKTVAIKADLLNFEDVKKLVPEANKQLGEITLLVNSASLFEHVQFMETDENTYDSHMDIHVKAPFFLAQEFALQCKSKGQIINIIDSSVMQNDGGHFAYFVAKKALRNLSEMLAYKLAPNILVNAVFPGVIEEFSNNTNADYLRKRIQQLPMKKLATAQQVIETIIAMTKSPLTGQEIFVDGGEQLI